LLITSYFIFIFCFQFARAVAGDLISAQLRERLPSLCERDAVLPDDWAGIPGRVSKDTSWVALISSSKTGAVEQSVVLRRQILYLNFLRVVFFQML